MYFSDFESYIQSVEGAKTITLVVELVGGGDVTSSPIPFAAYTNVIADLEDAHETRTPVIVWCRSSSYKSNESMNTVVMIPYEQIKNIKIHLTGQ